MTVKKKDTLRSPEKPADETLPPVGSDTAATQHDEHGAAAGSHEADLRAVRLADPGYLAERLARGDVAGVLSTADRGELAGADLVMLEAEPGAGGPARGWGVVQLRPGVRFEVGADAVAKLGDKLAAAQRASFAEQPAPCWFHPLALVDGWPEPRPVHMTAELPAEVDKRAGGYFTRPHRCAAAGCSSLAVVGIVWADGRGVAPACREHVEALEAQIAESCKAEGIDPAIVARRKLPQPGDDGVHKRAGLRPLWGSPGGKSAVAERLAALLPDHDCYVEPFAGSGAVLWAKDPAKREAVNDLDPEIAAAFAAVKGLSADGLKRIAGLDWTGAAETYKRIKASSPRGAVAKLHRFLYLTRFSFVKTRASYDAAGNGQTCRVAGRLEAARDRLRSVSVHSADYAEIVKRYDGPRTVFFFDPPYTGSYGLERTASESKAGTGESHFDDGAFVKVLQGIKGRWLLTCGEGALPKALRAVGIKPAGKIHTRAMMRTRRNASGSGGTLTNLLFANYPLGRVSKADDEQAVAEQAGGFVLLDSLRVDFAEVGVVEVDPVGEQPDAERLTPRGLRELADDDLLALLEALAVRFDESIRGGDTEADVLAAARVVIREANRRELTLPELPFVRAATAADPDAGNPQDSVTDVIYNLLVREDLKSKRRANFCTPVKNGTDEPVEKAAPHPLPSKPGPLPAVYQLHARGRSLHGDFRVQLGSDQAVGWTLAIQRAGSVADPVETVDELRQLAKGLTADGNAAHKPLVAPARVRAEPKRTHDPSWLKIDGKVIKPGEIGATANEAGIVVAVDRPSVEIGRTDGSFAEYFATGGDVLRGRLLVRKLDGETWIAHVSESAVPSVLSRGAVRAGVMPPDGVSWIPRTLEAVTPRAFRYWTKTGGEARKVRDALVESGFFTDDNVQLVGRQFRRVVRKSWIYSGDGDTPLEKALEGAKRRPVAELPQRGGTEPGSVFSPQRAGASYTDAAELVREHATADRLRGGLAVEPKIDGLEIVCARDSDGAVLIYFAGDRRNRAAQLPALAKATARLPAAAVLVGVLVEHDDKGAPLPHGELDRFKSGAAHDDSRARVHVVDLLWWGDQSLASQSWLERKRWRDARLGRRQLGPFVNVQARVAHEADAVKAGITWAGQHPGSSGAVVRDVTAAYQTGGRADGSAEITTSRIVNALVIGAGGAELHFAVGPVDERSAGEYQNTVEHGGRRYVPIGSAAAGNVSAASGDVVRCTVAGLLVVDRPGSRRLSWISPAVVERVKIPPDTVAAVRSLARQDETVRKLVEVSIVKRESDDEQRFVLGVVLEPNDGDNGAPLKPDAQKHVYSAEAIREAAHLYLADYGRLGYMHDRLASKREMVVVESYVAPVDMEIGGQLVRRGTWLLGAKILSDELWAKIKSGQINAWSVDGRAVVRPARAAA